MLMGTQNRIDQIDAAMALSVSSISELMNVGLHFDFVAWIYGRCFANSSEFGQSTIYALATDFVEQWRTYKVNFSNGKWFVYDIEPVIKLHRDIERLILFLARAKEILDSPETVFGESVMRSNNLYSGDIDNLIITFHAG